MNTLLTFFAVLINFTQEKPVDIKKKDLPKEAECVSCVLFGESHGLEKPAAGVMYKGKPYYFCNSKEVAAFRKDPEAFLPPVLPRPMSEFNLFDTDGKTWDAEAINGKLVMVDFWATWCGPCKAMFPIFDKLYEKYADKGYVLLSVSVDEKKDAFDKFLKSHKFPNPVLFDTTGIYGKWGVRSIPATFLIKGGKVIAQWTGKQTLKTLADAVESNLPK